jgi:hypothetical protein
MGAVPVMVRSRFCQIPIHFTHVSVMLHIVYSGLGYSHIPVEK